MIQQSHPWAHTQRRPQLGKIHAPQCWQQRDLEQPRHGDNQSVHQQRNGWRRCHTHTHTETTKVSTTRRHTHTHTHTHTHGDNQSVHQQMNGWRRRHTHTHTHTHSGILLSHKKNKVMPFAATLMDLETVILTEVSQRKTGIVWYRL